jgi:hypothetical protein
VILGSGAGRPSVKLLHQAGILGIRGHGPTRRRRRRALGTHGGRLGKAVPRCKDAGGQDEPDDGS